MAVLVPGPAVGEELIVVAVESAEEHVAHSELDKDMGEVASAAEEHNADTDIRLGEAEARSG